MTTFPARVAEAWRDTAWRYVIELPPPNFTGLTDAKHLPCRVVLVGTTTSVFEGTHAECQAWIDEQCGRAAARVVLEAMGEPSEAMVEAGWSAACQADVDISPLHIEFDCVRAMVRAVLIDAVAAFRREMGL